MYFRVVLKLRYNLVLLNKLIPRVFTSIFQIHGVQTILQTFPAATEEEGKVLLIVFLTVILKDIDVL